MPTAVSFSPSAFNYLEVENEFQNVQVFSLALSYFSILFLPIMFKLLLCINNFFYAC